MRRLFLLLGFLPLTALAQLAGQEQGTILYPYKKPMPAATVVEEGSGAIPTDGTAMGKKIRKNQRHSSSGPTWVYREPGDKKPTYITGPNGTTVCTDANGRVTVCW